MIPRRISSSASSIARPATSTGAIAHFERALAGAPDHPALLNNLGLALDKARTARRRRSEVPAHARARARRAQRARQSRAEPVPATTLSDAVPLFDRLIARLPTAPVEIWANRGVCAADVRDASLPPEASLMRATELAPELPEPWRDLGVTRTALQHWGGAAIALRRAFELDPTDRVDRERCCCTSTGTRRTGRTIARLRARHDRRRRRILRHAPTMHTLDRPVPAPGDQRRSRRSSSPSRADGLTSEFLPVSAPRARRAARRRQAPAGIRVGRPALASGRATDRRPVRATRSQALRRVRLLDAARRRQDDVPAAHRRARSTGFRSYPVVDALRDRRRDARRRHRRRVRPDRLHGRRRAERARAPPGAGAGQLPRLHRHAGVAPRSTGS